MNEVGGEGSDDFRGKRPGGGIEGAALKLEVWEVTLWFRLEFTKGDIQRGRRDDFMFTWARDDDTRWGSGREGEKHDDDECCECVGGMHCRKVFEMLMT